MQKVFMRCIYEQELFYMHKIYKPNKTHNLFKIENIALLFFLIKLLKRREKIIIFNKLCVFIWLIFLNNALKVSVCLNIRGNN